MGGADPGEITELLAGAVGKVCWSVMISERTDYVIVLELGEKLRRSMRLANPRLSFLQRTYEGELSFLIECSWRLDGPKGVVVTCFDSNVPGGAMASGLSELEGRAITAVVVHNCGFDLEIAFDGGFVLRCLSTETDVRKRRNNWSFWGPDGLVTCAPKGRIVRETRAQAEKRFGELRAEIAKQKGEDEDDG